MRTPSFWYAAESRTARALAGALDPLGRLYGVAGRLRLALGSPAAVGVPVLCVGNLVAGGAGKTPVAIALAERLPGAHVVTRGHGGSLRGPARVDPARHGPAEVGDEALLLARARPTWVARDRAAGAAAAVAAGARAVILDDGFQNPALRKDLSLVVVDGAVGFGNGRLVPAGPLREPVARGLARAQAVVLVGEDRTDLRHRLDARLPVLGARLVPVPGSGVPRGLRAVAFAGIGRPGKFFETCRMLGIDLVRAVPFADHHPFTEGELAALAAEAERAGAALLTTEKDAVRLPPGWAGRVRVLPVRLVWDDPGAVDGLLDRFLGPAGRGAGHPEANRSEHPGEHGHGA
ncbi:tetraacyldisaccharide 4'-kinase [Arenibaculum pallidiluteum]|uniref:tetraacyldisaccharide 4'-kinase n=1 Tax=Arenibaculum pallidiluteum TaxID=2812559 RepID=UPI001A97416C|nr:tetraacyldisaccharide 4'-kinase [Arenibaculum pallidiluteum]